MSFASKLKSLREARGLSREELAELAGMAKAGIANLEQGRTKPYWDTVVALANALQVKCDAFQSADDEPEPPPTPRGRPKKDEAQEADSEVKRPRGRPKKETSSDES